MVKRERLSKFEPYYEEIETKLKLPGSTVKAVFKYMQRKYGTTVFNNYWSLYSYCKNKNIRPVTSRTAHVRYETSPGDQLQIDWKEDIKLELKDGTIIQFNLFCATFGFSRFHYFIYSKTRTTEDFLRCLIEVLHRVGGMPKHILTDNMAAIVSITNGTKRKHKIIRQFENDTGIDIKLCKVRSPETKGKVESANRFVQWFIPYNCELNSENEILDLVDELISQVNKEKNATTNIPPSILMRKEKEHLLPIPNKLLLDSYIRDIFVQEVPQTLLVTYQGNGYSVPQKFIGKRVKVVPIDNKLYIYFNTTLVCVHDISEKKINYELDHYIQGLSTVIRDDLEEIQKKAEQNLKLFDNL